MTRTSRYLAGVVTTVIMSTVIACGPTPKPTTATAPWTLTDGGWWASVTPISQAAPNDPNQPPPPPSVSISSDLLFAFGSSRLSAQADKVIADITAKLIASDVSIGIHGFCDDVGSDSTNLPLSRDRARAVADALVSNGFPRARITTVDGYGSAHPRAVPPDTPSNRAINRRVEIQILQP